MSESKQCSIEGCPRPVCSRGWCTTHYDRWRKGRDVNAPIGPYGTKGICPADGCEKPATHKGWCLLHYARWRRRGDPLIAEPRRGAAELKAFRTQTKQCARCAQDFSPGTETEEEWAKRRFCSSECSRTSPLGSYAIDVIHVKICEVCGALIQRTPGGSRAQWAAKCTCSRACRRKLTRLNRRGIAYPLHWTPYQVRAEWGRRRKMPEWAAAWEDQRRQEDIYDIGARLPVLWQGPRVVQGGPVCHLNQSPRSRRFLCGWCPSCGNAWTYYAKRAQSRYCAECNEAHHKRPANRRARQNGALYEVIIPRVVFERDGYRCQICKRKTRGKFPRPLAPTVDHIIPLAVGGDHVYSNVQCACFSCNCRKQAGSANDQMRLAV